jgi:DNA replication protein DnaC
MNSTDQKLSEYLATVPQEIRCTVHPDVLRKLSYQHSRLWDPQYYACEKCAEEKCVRRLERAGVPKNMLHSRFSNWTATTEQERSHLEAVREFADLGRGFLIMLGPVGTGKSHLGIATLRRAVWDHHSVLFIKQSTLLRQLRDTYRDRDAEDPITQCQEVDWLVLDDAGLSGGGKDEPALLWEILDHRYGGMKPSIITSNLSWDQLRDELGTRMADRLKEAAFKILVFGGQSHRPERRDQYFQQVPTVPGHHPSASDAPQAEMER